MSSAVMTASPASAEDAITLSWDAPASCPPAASVLAGSYRLLTQRPRGPRHLVGEAKVERGPDGWRIALVTRVDGKEGLRELKEASSCREIAEFASLELALAYDPVAVLEAGAELEAMLRDAREAEAEREREQAGLAQRLERLRLAQRTGISAPPAEGTEDVADAGDELTIGGSVSALASADIGALPSVAIGFGGAAALRVGRFRVEAEGRYWLPQSSELAPGIGGDFAFASGALLAGPWWRIDRFGVGPQAGLELGWMRARGFGVDRRDDATLLWVAARVGGQGSVTIVAPLSLRLSVGIAVPFDRPRWVLDDIGVVDRPEPITGRADLGASIDF